VIHAKPGLAGEMPKGDMAAVRGEGDTIARTGECLDAEPSALVTVEGLSKMYRIFDDPLSLLKYRMLGRFCRDRGREFWALRDVSFEVKAGEMFGVIGRNGSGKSTLLQILAGILRPDSGRAIVRGTVAALLELGSGFHPDYTGRENVFMNGAIYGLSRKYIENRFDEIAAFADIGEFLDRPVKTYSSGMFLRLAFAVSTSLDSNVLLIDEALAVGDVFFRQKCYGRLRQLLDNGVAVILVSHAMGEVEQFCRRALVLGHGEAVYSGSATEAVRCYYLSEQQTCMNPDFTRANSAAVKRSGSEPEPSDGFWPSEELFFDISRVEQVSEGWAKCTALAICDSNVEACQVFQQGDTAVFFFEFEMLRDIEVPIGGIVIQNDKGVIVHGKSTLEYGSDVPVSVPAGGRLRFRQEIALELAVGEYTFEIGLATMALSDYERRSSFSHPDLSSKVALLCFLPHVFRFAVVYRLNGEPVRLLHHGIANLKGSCRVVALGGASTARHG